MLDFREACGYKRETHARTLSRFDRHCVEHFPEAVELTSEIVHSWLHEETNDSHYLTVSANAIRQFGKYLSAMDEKAYILYDKFAPCKDAFLPYNFTDAELSALFSALDTLPYENQEPFLTEIAPVFFRLVYTCGLRPAEGSVLQTENVNLKTGEMLITNTKFNKERIAVMSNDMLEYSKKYDLRRSIFAGASPFFFPAANGDAFTSIKMMRVLNKAWVSASCTPDTPVPRRIRVYSIITHLHLCI